MPSRDGGASHSAGIGEDTAATLLVGGIVFGGTGGTKAVVASGPPIAGGRWALAVLFMYFGGGFGGAPNGAVVTAVMYPCST